MNCLPNKLSNTLIHLPIDAHIHPYVRYTLMAFSWLQIISSITHPHSQLYQSTYWSNPALYSPVTALALAILFTFSYIILLVIRVTQAQEDNILVRPSMCLNYFTHVLIYFRSICEWVILCPLVVGCLKEFKNPDNSMTLGVAAVTIAFYLGIVIPIGLYCNSDTSVLNLNTERKIRIVNSDLIFELGKIILVATNQLSPEGMLTITSIYIVAYMLALVWRPIYCYHGQFLKRTFSCSITFICITRVGAAIFNQPEGSALIEVVGALAFAVSMDSLATFRLKQLINSPSLTITQIKLLFFMISNIQQYQEHLHSFIFQHGKTCSSFICKCRPLIDQLSGKEHQLISETAWWNFIISHVERQFDIKDIGTLPLTQMQLKSQKYAQVAYDLAEIYLDKLNIINKSVLVLSQFQSHASTHDLKHLLSERKKRNLIDTITEAIKKRHKDNESLANHAADKYLDYQIEYDSYFRLLLNSAASATNIWKELLKRDPDQATLLNNIGQFEQKNNIIQKQYKRLISKYAQSNALLDDITNKYFTLVLNVSTDDPLHPSKNQAQQKREQNKALDQNTKLFSYNSKTPVCFVSVEPESIGHIDFSNNFFDRLIKRQRGNYLKVDDLLIEGVRESHRNKMQAFVKNNQAFLNHQDRMIVDSTGKIIMTDMLVQMVPCLLKGMRYAVFFRNLYHSRKIFIFSSASGQFTHTSLSFDQIFGSKKDLDILKRKLNEKFLAELKATKVSQLTIWEENYKLNFRRQIISQNGKILMLQLKGVDEIPDSESQIQNQQEETMLKSIDPSRTHRNGVILKPSQIKKSTLKKKTLFASQITSPENIILEGSTLENTAVKQKKIDEMIKKSFDELTQTHTKRKILKFMLAIMIIFSLIAWINFIFLGIKKKTGTSQYTVASEKVNALVLFHANVTRSALNLLQLNLAQVVPSLNSTEAFKNIQSIPNFNSILANSNELTTIQQNWTALKLLTNGTFEPVTQSYMMAISDFVQLPLTTLSQDYNISDFNFPISFDYLTSPLSLIEKHFHSFMVNVLYIILPNLGTILQSKIFSLYYSGFTNDTLIIISLLMVALLFVTFMVMMIISCKIVNLKHDVYRLIEGLKIDLIQYKLNKCQKFRKKYSVSVEQIQIPQQSTIVPSVNGRQSKQCRSSLMKSTSRNLQDNTEGQIDVPGLSSKQKRKTMKQNKEMKKDNGIFKKSSQKIFTFQAISVFLPLIVISSLCSIYFNQELNHGKQIVKFQRTVGFAQQRIDQIRLYSLYYGVYPTLSNFPSSYSSTIPTMLLSNIQRFISISKALVAGHDFSFVPQAEKNINMLKGDICQLQQEGFFSEVNLSFHGRGNKSYCYSLSDRQLSEGLTASYLHYSENANRNYLLNSIQFSPSNYSKSERQAYQNNYFMTNISLMNNYLSMVNRKVLLTTKTDLRNTLNYYTAIVTALISLGCIWVFIMLFCLRHSFLNYYQKHITDIKTIMILISCKSIREDQQISQLYQQHLESLKFVI